MFNAPEALIPSEKESHPEDHESDAIDAEGDKGVGLDEPEKEFDA